MHKTYSIQKPLRIWRVATLHYLPILYRNPMCLISVIPGNGKGTEYIKERLLWIRWWTVFRISIPFLKRIFRTLIWVIFPLLIFPIFLLRAKRFRIFTLWLKSGLSFLSPKTLYFSIRQPLSPDWNILREEEKGKPKTCWTYGMYKISAPGGMPVFVTSWFPATVVIWTKKPKRIIFLCSRPMRKNESPSLFS